MAKSQPHRPSFLARGLGGLIRLYQVASSFGRRRCRFYPSCSEYTREALMELGVWKGLGHGMVRVLKCHPWHPGGIDFVRTERGK